MNQNVGLVIEAAVRSDELPGDRLSVARRFADRKAMRFLDQTSVAPFIAAMTALEVLSAPDATDLGLFTVSAWDPGVPRPPFALDNTVAVEERLARHYCKPDNPTDWLRRMPNNAVCQIAIASGLRGPNVHFVGRRTTVCLAAAIAAQTLADRAASRVLLLGYDLAPGHEHESTGDAVADAAIVVLGLAENGSSAEPVLDTLSGGCPDDRAVDALDSLITQSRSNPVTASAGAR
jgi:hypothetical protein